MKRIIGILAAMALAILVSCDLPIMKQLNNPLDPKASTNANASPTPSATPPPSPAPTPVASSAPDQTITLLAIPGVVSPVLGAVPVTTGIDTAQYSGTIAWSPADSTFAASSVYTANIVLTPKTGWTMTGVTANSFTVAGVTATNAANSGTVAAAFPATGNGEYSSATIGTLKYVPAGSFQRDATATNISTVSTAFRMSQYNISRAQFASVMMIDPSNLGNSSGTSDPVQMVSWYQAIAFCNKLSILEGLTQVYDVSGVTFSTLTNAMIPTASDSNWDAATLNLSATGYRLPTEMELMWAAMGATSDRSNGYTGVGVNTTGYAKGYAGSTEIGSAQANIGNYVWYTTNSGSKTHPGGGKLPNELGLYDMSGNVWKWCWDWDGSYPTGNLTDYQGPVSGTGREIFGGGWLTGGPSIAISTRYGYIAYSQHYDGGFRVVRH
jgi:formylglycine-generating enzyme required for sulfatase activity